MPEGLADPASVPRVLAFATLGAGSNDEQRIRDLLGELAPQLIPFDRTRKFRMFWRLLRSIRRSRPHLVVMEGTGAAGGAALIVARMLFGQRYVVSSGDAVGPWVGSQVRALGPVFGLYERVLCRLASGFIGWTPYLSGRALTFGTSHVMTAAGWAPFRQTPEEQATERLRIRGLLRIPLDNLVIGIAGSMSWSRRYGYCYGRELVEAARQIRRSDVTFLLIGDGSGRRRLETMASDLPAGRVVFTGRVPQKELPGYYAAMDAGSLPQSVDRVGSFRYTTKLSEYIAFRLPVITGQIPLSYDLDGGWLWRLRGTAPWDPLYVSELARLVDRIAVDELQKKRTAVPDAPPEFDRESQIARVGEFVRDLIAARIGQ
jgi:hypothetical protein